MPNCLTRSVIHCNTLAIQNPPPPDCWSPFPHQACSTHRRYPNLSPPTWACRQRAPCLMPTGLLCSPLSPSFSPKTITTSVWRFPLRSAVDHTAGCLALSKPRDAFLIALAKAAHPPRAEATDHHMRSRRCAPRLTGGLTLGLAGSGGGSRSRSGVGLSPRDFTCLRALVAAAIFLAGTLGPSWFAVLEALQNADYVLKTRGTAHHGSAASGPKSQWCSNTSFQVVL